MNYVNKVYSEKLLSYLPLYVIDAAKNNEAYLAGGALTSLFTDSKINDFDFYFKDGNKCADFIESIQGSVVVLQVTKRSITLKENNIGRIIQCIIFEYFDNAYSIFDKFDFTINMCAFDFSQNTFYMDDRFLPDLILRRLVINPNTLYPINTVFRIQKYKNRGYSISQEEILKLCILNSKQNIVTYGDLLNQISGIYGEEYLAIPKDKKEERIDLDNLKLSHNNNCLCDDKSHIDIFYGNNNYNFNCLTDIIRGKKYDFGCYINGAFIVKDKDHYCCLDKIFELFIPVCDASEMFPEEKIIVYKKVKFDSITQFASIYNNSFKYRTGEHSTALNDCGLFFSLVEQCSSSAFANKDDYVIICAHVNIDDIIHINTNGTITAKKCFVPENPIVFTEYNKSVLSKIGIFYC